MRRLTWIAAALAVACGQTPTTAPAPLDRLYRPTGLALHGGRLLAVSSNGDLLYDDATGGSLLSLDPSFDPSIASTVESAIDVRSFGGDLVVADPAVTDLERWWLHPGACPGIPGPVALFATRGSNVLFPVPIGAGGALTCDRCEVPLAGSFSDPLAVAVVCGGGRHSAFVGYLRAPDGAGWVTEYDLLTGKVVGNMSVGVGPVRSLAYDPVHDRLYVVGLATASPTPLRWIDLGGCAIGSATSPCSVGEAFVPGFTAASGTGLELRSMAFGAARTGEPQRAYLTGRLYDALSSVTAGGRIGDYGGLLLVVDLLEDARGGVELSVVDEHDIRGVGAQDVRVLPRAGAPDLLATVTVDDGTLWFYDDATGGPLTPFARNPLDGTPLPDTRDPATGIPVLGHEPFGLAIDPDPVGTAARLYVGSYRESWVTPIDVPLERPQDAFFTGGPGTAEQPHPALRITGGTP